MFTLKNKHFNTGIVFEHLTNILSFSPSKNIQFLNVYVSITV